MSVSLAECADKIASKWTVDHSFPNEDPPQSEDEPKPVPNREDEPEPNDEP